MLSSGTNKILTRPEDAMWVKFNNNPAGRVVGDCAIRAVSLALGVDWEEAYNLIADAGYAMGDMPSSDSVWGAVLRQHGFYREAIPNTCPDCYTVEDFVKDFPRCMIPGTAPTRCLCISGIRSDSPKTTTTPSGVRDGVVAGTQRRLMKKHTYRPAKTRQVARLKCNRWSIESQ